MLLAVAALLLLTCSTRHKAACEAGGGRVAARSTGARRSGVYCPLLAEVPRAVLGRQRCEYTHFDAATIEPPEKSLPVYGKRTQCAVTKKIICSCLILWSASSR